MKLNLWSFFLLMGAGEQSEKQGSEAGISSGLQAELREREENTGSGRGQTFPSTFTGV